MSLVVLSPAARADIDDAWYYIALDSGEPRADAYVERLFQVFEVLGSPSARGSTKEKAR
jgi:plasmid stabilization system protein ParE